MTAAERALVVLDTGAGIAALGGAAYARAGAPHIPADWLARSPFTSYAVPGLILGGVYAPVSLAAAWSLRRGHDAAGEVLLAAGVVQVGWIAAQVAIIGPRSFLQPLMGAVGIANLALARRRRQRRGQTAVAGRPTLAVSRLWAASPV